MKTPEELLAAKTSAIKNQKEQFDQYHDQQMNGKNGIYDRVRMVYPQMLRAAESLVEEAFNKGASYCEVYTYEPKSDDYYGNLFHKEISDRLLKQFSGIWLTERFPNGKESLSAKMGLGKKQGVRVFTTPAQNNGTPPV